MAEVHPTAVVDPAAELAGDVRVGPFCVVGPEVRLGAGVVLHQHAVVDGCTRLGDRVQVYAFAAVGTPPQDMKYAGEASRLEVGEGTVIREHCTLNPGTAGDRMETWVGRQCVLMVGTHIAHDCVIGDGVIFANGATLGGHVQIGERAFLGGLSAVHQFVRIGRGAMIGGMSGVENDVIPYAMVMGNRARLTGLNMVGLKRRGTAKAELHTLRAAYQELFHARSASFEARLAQVAERYADAPLVQDIVDFVRADTRRALCHPKAEHDA